MCLAPHAPPDPAPCRRTEEEALSSSRPRLRADRTSPRRQHPPPPAPDSDRGSARGGHAPPPAARPDAGPRPSPPAVSPEEAEEAGLALLKRDNPDAEWEIFAPTPEIVELADSELVKHGARPGHPSARAARAPRSGSGSVSRRAYAWLLVMPSALHACSDD